MCENLNRGAIFSAAKFGFVAKDNKINTGIKETPCSQGLF